MTDVTDPTVLEQELNAFAQAIQSHEQTLFHLIVSTNATQAALLAAGIISNADLEKHTKEEAEKLKNAYLTHMSSAAKEDSPTEPVAEDKSNLILP